MEELLQFLGETLFGVGLIVLFVFLGLGWYIRHLRTEIKKFKRF